MSDYAQFVWLKSENIIGEGIRATARDNLLFPFQRHLTEWALDRGRAAIFADCGLGKTPMQLEWARSVADVTGRPVIIIAPLAVSHQTVMEGAKFGIEVERSSDGKFDAGIVVTNYQRLQHFDPIEFGGAVLDESSILKSFNGATRQQITEFMRHIPYRLLCTATAAPNDYIELGTSSEALGYLGYVDLVNRYFVNDKGTTDFGRYHGQVAKYRFKGHAERPFWRYVSSWARAMRKPSDLGFEDGGFELPPICETEHIVEASRTRDGMLFALPAYGLQEEREEMRLSIGDRCDRVAELVDHDQPAVVWTHLNDESKRLARCIDGAVEVTGSDADEKKEESLLAFMRGEARVLVTKPKIAGFGLNLQHCAHVTMFPSHSYEQYYQAVRRCWRFGQNRPVQVDLVATDGTRGVLANLHRKQEQADRMFDSLVEHMRDAMMVTRANGYNKAEEMPSWL